MGRGVCVRGCFALLCVTFSGPRREATGSLPEMPPRRRAAASAPAPRSPRSPRASQRASASAPAEAGSSGKQARRARSGQPRPAGQHSGSGGGGGGRSSSPRGTRRKGARKGAGAGEGEGPGRAEGRASKKREAEALSGEQGSQRQEQEQAQEEQAGGKAARAGARAGGVPAAGAASAPTKLIGRETASAWHVRLIRLLAVAFVSGAVVALLLEAPRVLAVLNAANGGGAGSASRAPRCRAYVDGARLRRCASHARWEEWSDDVAHAVRHGAAGRARDAGAHAAARKATAVLMAVPASSAADGTAEAALLTTFRTECGGCQLLVDGSLVRSAGELQGRLADFLRRCQEGVVIIAGVDDLMPETLAPLNAAMGENGAFEADGQRVEATGGTFVLAARDADVRKRLGSAYGEREFTRAAKEALAARMRVKCSTDDERCMGTADALRRRIDFVGEFDPSADGCVA